MKFICDKCKKAVGVVYADRDSREASYHCEDCTPYLRKKEVNKGIMRARAEKREEQRRPEKDPIIYTRNKKKFVV